MSCSPTSGKSTQTYVACPKRLTGMDSSRGILGVLRQMTRSLRACLAFLFTFGSAYAASPAPENRRSSVLVAEELCGLKYDKFVVQSATQTSTSADDQASEFARSSTHLRRVPKTRRLRHAGAGKGCQSLTLARTSASALAWTGTRRWCFIWQRSGPHSAAARPDNLTCHMMRALYDQCGSRACNEIG